MTAETPEERRDLIRAGIEELAPLIVAAYKAKDHLYFGYTSWSAYVHSEFGGPLRLPRPQRREVTALMRDEGMSTRAIAAALAVNDRTVRRDLSGAANAAPDDVSGVDGKSYPTSKAEAEAALEFATGALAELGRAADERAARLALRSAALQRLHDLAEAIVDHHHVGRHARSEERPEVEALIAYMREEIDHVL